MRMGGEGPSAADVVSARLGARPRRHHLPRLARSAFARAIARAIVAARSRAADRDHAALAELVGARRARPPGEIHPATRTFQALRIFVNDELDELVAGLAAAERVLKPGGRLVVVTLPLARRPHRQDVPCRTRPRRRRVAPQPEAAQAAAELPHSDAASRSCRRRPRSPPIRARARPSCAPAERTDAPPRPPTSRHCCRACRRSPTSMRGR